MRTLKNFRFGSASLVICLAWLLFGCDDDHLPGNNFIPRPQNVRMVIDEGAAVTNDTLLRLAISGVDIDRMIISIDSLWRGAEWEDYIAQKMVSVPRREGRVNIYGRFAVNGGGTTDVHQAYIDLDLTACIISLNVLAPSDTLKFGDEVHFSMVTGEAGCAEIAFGSILSGYQLPLIDSGAYSRTLKIPAAVSDSAARVIGYFTDVAGNQALPFNSGIQFVVNSIPFQLQRVGSLRMPGARNIDVVFKSVFCFVSDAQQELLYVIDVRDPARPTLARMLPMADWTAGLCANDRALFVADGDGGIAVVGINPPGAAGEIARLLIYGKVRDVKLTQRCLYAACIYTGFWTVNIDEIYSPQAGQNVPLTGFGEKLCLNGNLVYITGSSGLSILNMEDVAKPKVISEIAIADVPSDVVFSEGHLIISTLLSGLKIVDVRTPRLPVIKQCYREFYSIRALELDPPFIFAGTDARILIINIGHIDRPQLVSQITGLRPVNGMCIDDKYLYIACEDGFEIVQLY